MKNNLISSLFTLIFNRYTRWECTGKSIPEVLKIEGVKDQMIIMDEYKRFDNYLGQEETKYMVSSYNSYARFFE